MISHLEEESRHANRIMILAVGLAAFAWLIFGVLRHRLPPAFTAPDRADAEARI